MNANHLHQTMSMASRRVGGDATDDALVAAALHQGQRHVRRRRVVAAASGALAGALLLVAGVSLLPMLGRGGAGSSTVVASQPSGAGQAVFTTPGATSLPVPQLITPTTQLPSSLNSYGATCLDDYDQPNEYDRAIGRFMIRRVINIKGQSMTCNEAVALDRSQNWVVGPTTRTVNGFICTVDRALDGDEVECRRGSGSTAQSYSGRNDESGSRFWQTCQPAAGVDASFKYSLFGRSEAAAGCQQAMEVMGQYQSAIRDHAATVKLPAGWLCQGATAEPLSSRTTWLTCTYFDADTSRDAQVRAGSRSLASETPGW